MKEQMEAEENAENFNDIAPDTEEGLEDDHREEFDHKLKVQNVG